MSEWASFEYRDFYDLPRSLVFTIPRCGRVLLDCPFDRTSDAYPDYYDVHLLPDGPLPDSWEDLNARGMQTLGRMPVSDLRLDPSLRRLVDIRSIPAGIREALGR